MAKHTTVDQLVRGQHIMFNDKVQRVGRVRRISHEEALLAVGDIEVKVPLNRKYLVVE